MVVTTNLIDQCSKSQIKPTHPLLSGNPLLGLQNQIAAQQATKDTTTHMTLPTIPTQALTQAQALAQAQVKL